MKKLLITAGEPAGIGYDILVEAAQMARSKPWLVLGDPVVLKARAAELQLSLQVEFFQEGVTPSCKAGVLTVWPFYFPETVKAGQLNAANAPKLVESLAQAADFCLKDPTCKLLTLPVHKGVINQAGIPFTGHTEFFAQRAQCNVVMLLGSSELRVALVTTHLPLKEVAATITFDKVCDALAIVCEHLRALNGLSTPRLAVLGLNPHAGEQGYLGREEVEIIAPAIQKMQSQLPANITGPWSADTFFQPKHLNDVDAVIAMYHDQGLAPLKALCFGKIVNVTCGLPFLRVSVDHGVALDIAGTGAARLESFWEAVSSLASLSRLRGSQESPSREWSTR